MANKNTSNFAGVFMYNSFNNFPFMMVSAGLDNAKFQIPKLNLWR
jgi:hypothetical protein